MLLTRFFFLFFLSSRNTSLCKLGTLRVDSELVSKVVWVAASVCYENRWNRNILQIDIWEKYVSSEDTGRNRMD